MIDTYFYIPISLLKPLCFLQDTVESKISQETRECWHEIFPMTVQAKLKELLLAMSLTGEVITHPFQALDKLYI